MDSIAGWLGDAASVAGVVTLVVTCLVLVVTCWALTLLGLPGNWLMAIVALVYNLLAPDGGRLELGRWCIVSLFLLAAVGEALETLAGALGVTRKGGSRRGALGALVGSLAGGILGASFGGVTVGLLIPIAGPVLAAILFGGLGALVGAMLAETTTGKDLTTSVDIGVAAMWGRVFGSLAKAIAGAVMVAVVIVGMIF